MGGQKGRAGTEFKVDSPYNRHWMSVLFWANTALLPKPYQRLFWAV